MAIDMNSEITSQNKQLDRINVQVSRISLCGFQCLILLASTTASSL